MFSGFYVQIERGFNIGTQYSNGGYRGSGKDGEWMEGAGKKLRVRDKNNGKFYIKKRTLGNNRFS